MTTPSGPSPSPPAGSGRRRRITLVHPVYDAVRQFRHRIQTRRHAEIDVAEVITMNVIQITKPYHVGAVLHIGKMRFQLQLL